LVTVLFGMVVHSCAVGSLELLQLLQEFTKHFKVQKALFIKYTAYLALRFANSNNLVL
jgi:hypothetical protein